MPGNMGHGPNRMSGEKVKFDMTSFKKIVTYSRSYIFAIIISLICACVGAVTTIIGPDKISELMDIITAGIFSQVDMTAFVRICVFLIFLYVIGSVFNYIQQFLMAIVSQKTSQRLRTDIDKKINKLPLSFFDKTTKGDLLSRITNDVDTIAQSLGSSIANLVSSVVLFFGLVFMMFKTNSLLALVTILTSTLGFVFMSIVLKRSQKYFDRRQNFLGELNGHIEEIYSNHDVVKSYNAVEFEAKKFNEYNTKLYCATWKAQFMSGLMMPIMVFVGNLAYVLIFVVGVSVIVNGGNGITLGTLMAFVIYAKLFSQPLSNFAQSMNYIQQASAAGKRVFDFLEEKEIKDETNKKTILDNAKVLGAVEFRNVRFAYTPSKVIIKNFSAKLDAGKKIAIVGPTGAGKTTIVNLLMRFYEIKQPRLIIDGELTTHKVFDNGKSIKMNTDESGNLCVGEIVTKFNLGDEFKNLKGIKFDQDFNLIFNDTKLTSKVNIITGNDIDKVDNENFAVAYYGDIFIDGVPTKSIKRDDLHNLFDMILQDTWLFNGTIRENLIFNTKGVTDARMKEVCDAVGLNHFISSLTNGYDTVLTDVNSLSEGQKQQLTIARAMLKDSPLLILDEATSNVDTRTETIIQQAMDELTKGRTSFVIAHRLSTIKNADEILVMKDGDIIEHGNHEALIKQNGFYAELYNSQFVQVS